ncbi:MAG: hypothetical protein K2H98_08165 [Duncaniella sp.]|nr:hypothetical protein [Duncaniella sp.]
MKISHCILMAVVAATAIFASSCDTINDERVPYAPVRVTFTTEGMWNIYGVTGATSAKRYIKAERIPANFPYTALDETGYGGLLVVCDIMGDPQVYDLCCPVEVRPNVRIYIPADETHARCPQCGSTYEVFSNYGIPLSGPAAERGYALKRYHVIYGGAAEYLVITR